MNLSVLQSRVVRLRQVPTHVPSVKVLVLVFVLIASLSAGLWLFDANKTDLRLAEESAYRHKLEAQIVSAQSIHDQENRVQTEIHQKQTEVADMDARLASVQRTAPSDRAEATELGGETVADLEAARNKATADLADLQSEWTILKDQGNAASTNAAPPSPSNTENSSSNERPGALEFAFIVASCVLVLACIIFLFTLMIYLFSSDEGRRTRAGGLVNYTLRYIFCSGIAVMSYLGFNVYFK